MRSDIFVRGKDVTLRFSPAPAASIDNERVHSVSSRIMSKWRAATSGETVESTTVYTWMRKKVAQLEEEAKEELKKRSGAKDYSELDDDDVLDLALALADKVDFAEEAKQAAEDEDIVEMIQEGGGGAGAGAGEIGRAHV